MRNPWEVYDRLIAGIPENIEVIDWSFGNRWSYVHSEVGVGLAHSVKGGATSKSLRGTSPITSDSIKLRELAAYAKSWCFEEATIGVAALTSWYNRPEQTPNLIVDDANIIDTLVDEAAGKKVIIVGHFPHLDRYYAKCQLTVLERNPSEDDLPDSACEYLIPEQDLLILTGTTLTNKTAVRLLELAQDTKVALAGPSVVCSDIWADYGVTTLGSTMVVDNEAIKTACHHGIHQRFGSATQSVVLTLKAKG